MSLRVWHRIRQPDGVQVGQYDVVAPRQREGPLPEERLRPRGRLQAQRQEYIH